jgi:hypothetical protein
MMRMRRSTVYERDRHDRDVLSSSRLARLVTERQDRSGRRRRRI